MPENRLRQDAPDTRNDDRDLSGVRVCIISQNPKLSVDLAGRLVALGLDVDTFATPRDSERARMAHVVVADLRNIDVTGAIDELRQHYYTARLVVVKSADEEEISRNLEYGLHGWLMEGEPARAMASAIIAVARGTISLSQPVFSVLANHLSQRGDVGIGRAVRAGLSRRQIEVIMLAAQGRTDGEIAHELTLSVRTVNRHVADILRKLGVKSRREAIKLALGEPPILPLTSPVEKAPET